MKGLLLAKRWGAKVISLLLLVTALLVSLLLFQYLQADQWQQAADREKQTRQQHFNILQLNLEKAIYHQQQQLAALADSSRLQVLLANPEPEAVKNWQTQVSESLPAVKGVCLLLTLPEAPGSHDCLPVSFATLANLRQLKEQSQSDIAMMQPGSEQAHILLAQRVSMSGYPDATLAMMLKPGWLDGVIDDSFVAGGYAQINQGKKSATMLTAWGNPQNKNAEAAYSLPVKDSYWTLQFWPRPLAKQSGWLFLVVTFALLIVAWVLRELWFARLLRGDAKTLQQQLHDLEEHQLKPVYPVITAELRPISEYIHDLVIPPRKVTPANNDKPAQPIVEPAEEVMLSSDPEQIVEHAIEQAAKQETVEPNSNELEFDTRETPVTQPLLPDQAIFRQYDVRGKVGSQLNAEVMLQLGQAVGSEALDQSQNKLVLGRDGRLSSDSLAEAFIKGVLSSGCDVIDVGQVPTPVVYFGCEHLETHTGAMITGSHNPTDYNGLKIVIAGKTLLGEGVQRLYQRIKDNRLKKGQGQLSREDIKQAYIDRIRNEISLPRSMRIVVDCGNGVAGNVAPDLFRALGCEVIELFSEVDGHFPNHHPDPGQPENMQDLIKTVQSQEAELGLAYDGDGDRLGVVDAGGNIIWPDRLLLLMAQYVLVDHPGATVLYDVKCTNMLDEVIGRAGGNPVMTPSGHSVIKSLMVEHDAMLAGEMTGHFFFRDRWYGFDDALYSAARLLELLAADPLERTPTEVFAALPSRISTPEIIVEMAEGESHRFIEQLQANVEFVGGKLSTVDGIRVDYPKGWGLVRASNTVPGLTLRFEATSQEELEHIKQEFIQQMLQIKPTLSLLF